jgi:hypothetical protein
MGKGAPRLQDGSTTTGSEAHLDSVLIGEIQAEQAKKELVEANLVRRFDRESTQPRPPVRGLIQKAASA